MSCIRQKVSCLESTLTRQELSSNLLVPHAFSCQVLVCFLIHGIFLAVAKDLMQSVRSDRQNAIIRKTEVVECFLVKFALF